MHKVVFPFKNISDFRLSLKHGTTYPNYDAFGNFNSVDIVTSLFDTYEEAHEIATKKNEEMQSNLISDISFSDKNWKDKYEKLKIDFLANLNVCHEFEKLIITQTEHMNVSDSLVDINVKKLQKSKF